MGVQTDRPLTKSQLERLARRTRGAGEAIEHAWSDSWLPKIEKFCRERPLTAIAIGVGVGIALRSLLARR